MIKELYSPYNPKLDLLLERDIDVNVDILWSVLTTPEHVMKWFAPAPWKVIDCEIELRPGGQFRSVMQSPEGKKFPNTGCYLEIIKTEKLVWTSALQPGYRPVKKAENAPELLFTAMTILKPHSRGTKYYTIAIHNDEETCRRHDEMGFQKGWGTSLDQLIAVAKKL